MINARVAQNESSLYAAAALYDPSQQPSVIKMDPSELTAGASGVGGYDYSQYYYQYYQQMASAAASDPAQSGGQGGVPGYAYPNPNETASGTSYPPTGYDYSAYYAAYYGQQPPPAS
jgi:hypothetical protein